MALTADQILAELRALPPAERLRVVERVVHEVAAEVTPEPPRLEASHAIWADEGDTDFERFQRAVQELRATDVWRADNGQVSR